MNRRSFLMTGTAAVLAAPVMAQDAPTIDVLKSPTCGCCSAWVDHLRQAGFDVVAQDVDQDVLYAAKDRLGITGDLASCHTARVGDYFLEGHVPAVDITRLLSEMPKARGLAVPGMPMSSPGMGGPGAGDTFETLLVAMDGDVSVWSTNS